MKLIDSGGLPPTQQETESEEGIFITLTDLKRTNMLLMGTTDMSLIFEKTGLRDVRPGLT